MSRPEKNSSGTGKEGPPLAGSAISEWTWDAGAPTFNLAPDEVHLWRFSLEPDSQDVHELAGLLNPEEQQRMQRYKRPVHGRRFATGRGVLRLLLGAYLAHPPASPLT